MVGITIVIAQYRTSRHGALPAAVAGTEFQLLHQLPTLIGIVPRVHIARDVLHAAAGSECLTLRPMAAWSEVSPGSLGLVLMPWLKTVPVVQSVALGGAWAANILNAIMQDVDLC